jgi:hypothetical protein
VILIDCEWERIEMWGHTKDEKSIESDWLPLFGWTISFEWERVRMIWVNWFKRYSILTWSLNPNSCVSLNDKNEMKTNREYEEREGERRGKRSDWLHCWKCF